jgi:ABC-type transport system involved in multi-copper enzyme maturation permease subunit
MVDFLPKKMTVRQFLIAIIFLIFSISFFGIAIASAAIGEWKAVVMNAALFIGTGLGCVLIFYGIIDVEKKE